MVATHTPNMSFKLSLMFENEPLEVRQVEGRVEEAGHYVFNQYSSWAWVLVWYAYKTGAEEPHVIEGTSIAHPEKSLSC